MSSFFMVAIGVMYLGAAASFIYKGEFVWSSVALSWAVGNLALAWISR